MVRTIVYRVINVLILFSCTLHCNAQGKRMNYFQLSDVRLLESPFKKAQDLDRHYMLEMDIDRLLAPYRREACLNKKAESYSNWESTGLDGHMAGHYLSALSLMFASTGDTIIKSRIDYMVDELELCQKANGNGYIGGVPGSKELWTEIKKGNIHSTRFELNGKWVPLYNIHKMYSGLFDAWYYGKNQKAKKLLIGFANWMVETTKDLSKEQIQKMLVSEHGGLNEIFADIYDMTHDKEYLDLAIKFSDLSLLYPLAEKRDILTGLHANTQLPKVIGFKRISEVTSDTVWAKASKFFWETVTEHRTICIGGNSVREHFNPVHDFSSMVKSEQGVETCNTYNMLKLSKMLYRTSGDSRYMDYYERALYNHILSSQNPKTGGMVYFTQMRPGHYRVYSQPHTSMWCCVGTGLENHAKYGDLIYAYDEKGIYVNLFIPSVLNWKDKGILIRQENDFPEKSVTNIIVSPEKKKHFTVYLRCPQWTEGSTIKINGKFVTDAKLSNGYWVISRNWTKNDTIEYTMPMQLQVESLPDHSPYMAFVYGPVVLAAKTDVEDMDGLYADDSRMGHVAKGRLIPMKEVPVLISERGKELSHIIQSDTKPMSFVLDSLYQKNHWCEYTLEPFYRLHDSRYIIYWPTSTLQELDSIKQATEDEEKKLLMLNQVTTDAVYCGQQQPESDHFIKHGNSSMGYTEGWHWRSAKDWFGYKMNYNVRPKAVYIKYFDSLKKRNMNIVIDGRIVAKISLEKGKDDELKEEILDVSDYDFNTEGQLDLRFVGTDNTATAKIVEVRLLSDIIKIP